MFGTDTDRWRLRDIPDLSGTVAVVTGANSGIGLAVTRHLGANGARVVMACRSQHRAKHARQRIAESVDADLLHVYNCDLTDLTSVESFVTSVTSDFDALHLLCNNAGIMAIPRRETVQGFERQFGVNHLGHVKLTAGLLAMLAETDGETRVITQGSGTHRRVKRFNIDNLIDPSTYHPWRAYYRSKLANALFALELDRRLERVDLDVRSVCCEPGFVRTNLPFKGPRMENNRLKLVLWRVAQLVARSPDAGAQSMLFAAVSDEIGRGDYVQPAYFAYRGPPTIASPSDLALDEALASELWERSLAWTDSSFDLLDTST